MIDAAYVQYVNLVIDITGFILNIFLISAFSNSDNAVTTYSELNIYQLDTSSISNRIAGSKIMTDQDALDILPPPGKKLVSIDLFYSNVDTTTSYSSPPWVKSQRSWSCGPIGNADPLNADTLYIWPDLIQQVQPRIDYASTKNYEPGLWYLTGTLCASPPLDLSILDYKCELIFIESPPCLPFIEFTQINSSCYFADTIVLNASLRAAQSLSLYSSKEVYISDSLQIDSACQISVNMNGCNYS